MSHQVIQRRGDGLRACYSKTQAGPGRKHCVAGVFPSPGNAKPTETVTGSVVTQS